MAAVAVGERLTWGLTCSALVFGGVVFENVLIFLLFWKPWVSLHYV